VVGEMVNGRVILDLLITYTGRIEPKTTDKLLRNECAALNFGYP